VTGVQFLIVVGGIAYLTLVVPRIILRRDTPVTRTRILITALGMAILGLLLIYVR
jgi:branched-subunit amino acid transport protein AzlD